MNHSKLILSLSCFVAVTLASPLVTAAPRGGGGGHGGGHFSGGRSFAGRPGMGAGAAGIGMAAIGAVVTGMVATGAVAIGTAIGTVITVTTMLSSSATSAFPAGGAGVGAGILTEATPIMDTMITVTRTVTTATAMDINIPATAMGIPADTAIIMGMGTAMDTPVEIVANTRLLPGRK